MQSKSPELENAIAQHRLGQVDVAQPVYRALTQSHPDLSEPWHMLGVVHLQRGDAMQAEPLFRQALKRDANHIKCHSNLGAALYQLQRFAEAEKELRTALRLDSDYIDALYNLGNVLISLSKPDEAMSFFDATLKLNPNHVKALINTGELLQRAHLNVEAKTRLQKAQKLVPNDFGCLINLTIVLERLNDITGARDAIAKALPQHPHDPRANLVAALIDLRDKHPDQALARIAITLNHALDTATEVMALFTRARAYEDLQQSDEAFTAYSKANALELKYARERGIRPEKYLKRLDDAHKRLDAGAVVPGSQAPLPGEPRALVFFVGFPRSGTTLFEQMLSSHPDIVTTNENSPLNKILNRMDTTQPAHTIEERTQKSLRAEFWREAQNIVGDIDGRVFIDTAPLNIWALDIAARLFPEAKILMILRDPRDVCLSCFMQSFQSNDELANFLSLQTTVHVYDKLMGLWLRQKDLIQTPWLEIHYEDLVRDMKGTTTVALDFLELDWADEILSYRDKAKEGHITTPSSRQVGEKLHTRAFERWRRYEKHLAPIWGPLLPYVQAFGYKD